MALVEQLHYTTADVYVPRTTLYASQLNSVMAKVQAELEVRDGWTRGWLAVPTMNGAGSTLTVETTGDGLIIVGQRWEGSDTLSFAGAAANTYIVQVKTDGTLYKAAAAHADYLTVGTTVWNGAAFGTITVTATVGPILTGVGDVSGPGASVDGELAAFSGVGGDTLVGTGIDKTAAAAALALAHAQAHSTGDHTDLAEDSASHSGLDYGYKAGKIRVGVGYVEVAASTVTLADDDTNYVECSDAGVVSANTTSFTAGSIPMAIVVTASGEIDTVTEQRAWLALDASYDDVVHSTGAESIDGVKTFTSSPIIPEPDGADPTEAANVGYVQSVATGLAWQEPVLAMDLTAPPGGESGGERYVVAAVASGAWAGQETKVAEYNGATWDFYAPEAGWTVLNLDTAPLQQFTWNALTSTWVQSGGAADAYTGSDGVKLTLLDFSLDLSDTNPALEIADGGVRVKVDDSSIERVAGGVQVKALGVTNAMLAGSIANDKLAIINTAGKVSGEALTSLTGVPAGAGVLPSANLGSGGSGAGAKALFDDGTFKVPSASLPTTTCVDIDILSYSTSTVAWGSQPAADTEFRGDTYSRFTFDASTASQYRLLSYQMATGAAGACLNLQYSDDGGSTWYDADAAEAGALPLDTGTGTQDGAWADLVAGAQADRLWRIIGYTGGSSAGNPSWRMLRVQFKVPGGSGGSYIEGTLVTTVGSPGSDSNVPSEQAVREAIEAIPATEANAAPNLIDNSEFAIDQRGAGVNRTSTDDTYGLDRWYTLCEGNATIERIASGLNTSSYAARLTTPALNRYGGLAQVMESVKSVPYRGRTMQLQARVRCASAVTVRWAILEWTSTADSVTSGVVEDWTDATIGAGNFFLTTNITVAATGNQEVLADTWTALSGSGAISTSCNNQIVMIWSDYADSNATLDITEVDFFAGSATRTWSPKDPGADQTECQRHCYAPPTDANTRPNAVQQGTNLIRGALFVFPVTMRIVPAVSSNISAWGAPSPTTTQAAAYNARAGANLTIVGALTIGYYQIDRSQFNLGFGAGTSFSGHAGDWLYIYLGPDVKIICTADL